MLKVLSDTPNNVQCLEALGTVTAEDYAQVFAPLVAQARSTGHRMRLLYQFGPDFKSITPGALWADTRLGIDYVRQLDGCAIASDIGWIRAPSLSIGMWMPCPVQIYTYAERDAAAAWLTSLPTLDGASAASMAKAYIGGVTGAVSSLAKLLITDRVKGHHEAA
ncbi:hypothetical protein ABIA30_004056 [Mycobacterium sp. MAA66]|uniref:STAS/SEC14 domain-containing protein n=1 Tax=Mycobacterium sp. MAA66 TaxID=3156297 RepID=UPI0035143FAB